MRTQNGALPEGGDKPTPLQPEKQYPNKVLQPPSAPERDRLGISPQLAGRRAEVGGLEADVIKKIPKKAIRKEGPQSTLGFPPGAAGRRAQEGGKDADVKEKRRELEQEEVTTEKGNQIGEKEGLATARRPVSRPRLPAQTGYVEAV